MSIPVETPTGHRADALAGRRSAWPFGNRMAVAALVLGAAGNTLQAVLGQFTASKPDTVQEQIVWANEHAAVATTMAVSGTVAIFFMAVGFVAVAAVLRQHARRTANIAAGLLVWGMWGFFAIQVAELVQLTAMLDPAGHAAAAHLDGLDSVPVLGVLFGAPFMLGVPLGLIVLTVGLLVKGGAPRWMAGLWLAFLVLDFGVGAIGPVDPHWLYLAGAVGFARHIARPRPGQANA